MLRLQCIGMRLWNYAISCQQIQCESSVYLTPVKRPGAHWVHDSDGMCEVSAGNATPATVMAQSLEWFHKDISKQSPVTEDTENFHLQLIECAVLTFTLGDPGQIM